MFENKVLLITGGTGSFGNAVLSRFLSSDISEIRIFSRDEKKQDEMRKRYNNPKLKFYIGDVRDYQSVLNAVRGVDYVFHAAALKQVPSCEFYPLEAVKTNINGTENVVSSSIYNKVKTLVLLSTDKAVYPVNSMGLTKAIAEKIIISKSRLESSKTILCATRYGNVMGSRGSVIPLFKKQIESGLTPQLTLEAAIAAQGKFKGVNPADISMLVYMRLSGGKPPGEESGIYEDVEALAADALKGLKQRVADFDNESTPYLSRPVPQFLSRFGDYDHLARVKEWMASDDNEEGDR
mgnify:CR=1 FL=1